MPLIDDVADRLPNEVRADGMTLASVLIELGSLGVYATGKRES